MIEITQMRMLKQTLFFTVRYFLVFTIPLLLVRIALDQPTIKYSLVCLIAAGLSVHSLLKIFKQLEIKLGLV
jgi:hypothetical protein